ncbi:GTP-binding protein, partial [Staphylococcus aureus]|uniref:GTP-binding protein n=1 Tax=Staphylococcus aureus TaxID=1280 RepID=UPI00210AD015
TIENEDVAKDIYQVVAHQGYVKRFQVVEPSLQDIFIEKVGGVVLVVDAYEGTMPQTRFVLKKALEQNPKPVVVVNKIDKPSARPEGVVDEDLDLFIELEANDEQLEFPVVYASAVNGPASIDPETQA